MSVTVNFEDLFSRRVSHIQVYGEGVVTAILNDDLVGHKHQRFVVELGRHKTIMIVNNIDLSPRLAPLDIGDRVAFFGEYIWNRHGGLVHWTHHDPKGQRDDGYVKLVTDVSEQEPPPIPLGVYRHFKGNFYQVQGFALHSETLEKMVIYQALYGESKTWVRPLAMWQEQVFFQGQMVPRFALKED